MSNNLELELVYIDDLLIGKRLRPLDETAVCALVESIRRFGGLKNPIAIRWDNNEDGELVPVLVAGLHRVEACKRLEIERVPGIVVQDETEARLWEIAENLHRADLTVQERADHIAEWIRLTEDKMGQLAPFSSNAKTGAGRGNKGGLRAAVRDLGVEHREARRAVKIASIPEPARQAADDAGLTTQKARLRVAQAQDPLAEVEIIRRQREQKALVSEEGESKIDHSGAAAQIIVEHVPQDKLPDLMAHLKASGDQALVSALARSIDRRPGSGASRLRVVQ